MRRWQESRRTDPANFGGKKYTNKLRRCVAFARLSVSVDERKKRTRSKKSAQAAKGEQAKKGGKGEVWLQNFVLVHLILSTQSSRGFCIFFSIRFPTFLKPRTGYNRRFDTRRG